ncbi:metal-dependent hydrolase [Actinoalloteichus sp. AHMU CJ021]|uniref:LexA-binding, inner membrane-associated putative hydrolase n=1 Tax=Actinoalloteichus caeruleus DSM 43889 TaxID=1120930 RepID=A0ABT1JM04_ACTCY|nr:metal-dependent hydrolase [Actinoalloteichus caeruleus]AUS79280.1 metal-dependent hydrolase [Actinoalloteichus sp. AHMU CJ021]MCP2333552.1 LexA-binding, inner membrane-associated putative hydrolase [Actinoalloteichus caeruleus DSM 43889]
MATGPTHAISGLATWAAVTALANTHSIGQLSPKTWVVGATLASGAALLPDIDHPNSTVARTFGSASRGVSAAVNTISGWVYKVTKTKKDSNRDGGHRGLTHTLVFALLMGVVTTAVVQASDGGALAVLMFVFAGLAIRGIMHQWCPRRDATLITVASLVLTVLCWAWAGTEPHNPAVFGVAVILGCTAHYLGDAITQQGCSMFWPVPIKWKTWYPVRLPKAFRMSTGSKVEMVVVLPLLTVAATILSAIVLYRTGAAPWLAELGILNR